MAATQDRRGEPGPPVDAGLGEAVAALRGVYGLPISGIENGLGSWLTLDLGDPGGGGWVLWIELAAWRLESENGVLASSEDSDLEGRVGTLAGRAMTGIDVDPATMDTVFSFSGDLALRTFSQFTEPDMTYWYLFLPDGRVFLAESGPNWALEPADLQRPLDWLRPGRPSAELAARSLPIGPDLTEAVEVLAALRGGVVRRAGIEDDALWLEVGESVVAVTSASWRIEASGRILAGHDDSAGLAVLDGQALREVRVTAGTLDAAFSFADELVLRVFPVHTVAVPHWTVLLPDGSAATAGPGPAWSVQPAAA